MSKSKTSGALIVSWNFSHDLDKHILLVGRKTPLADGVLADVKIINAFQGEEAHDIYEKLTTVKKAEATTRLKIMEINPEFKAAVDANDGYCPCLIDRNADTKCMCKDFREQTEPGPCHCGRFEKVAGEISV
jgi:hypothetical protein